MKKIILTAVIALMGMVSANAQGYYGTSSGTYGSRSNSYGSSTNSSVRYQQGYTRTDGTYVQGHYKTNTNSTNHDNFSTRGNVNSYTGTSGSRARDYSTGAYNYGSGHTIPVVVIGLMFRSADKQ